MKIRINHQGSTATIRCPYDPDVVEAVKAHGGHWSPDRKVWTVISWSIPELVAELRMLGHTVTGNVGDSADSTAHLRARIRELQAELAENRATGGELRAFLTRFGLPGYRALVKVAHPDAGGDHGWTIRINDAWQDVQQRQDGAAR